MPKMNILIGSDDFQNRTGMPMYILTLSRELIKRGHNVEIVSFLTGLVPSTELKQHIYWTFNPTSIKPDVLLLNEPRSERLLNYYPCVPAYNIIHSPRPVDEPIRRQPQIRKYIAVKKEDRAYIKSKGIDEKFITNIPIPIDVKHFRSWKRPRTWKKKHVWDIASIATFDAWRGPMLKDLISRAKKGKKVLLMGQDHGAIGDLIQYRDISNLTIIPIAQPDVRPFIARSKCVAGLFEGTITAEAWAMGKATWIYDREGRVVKQYSKPPKDFMKYDIRSVARQFEDLFNEKWADVIIPHKKSPKMDAYLKQCVASIPKRNYNIHVIEGGSFAQNCNAGAKKAKTGTLIFFNNDMIANPMALWEILDHKADICGGQTIYPDGRDQYCGLGLKWNPYKQRVEYFLTANTNEACMASGGFFKVSKEWFMKAGNPEYRGFDEGYVTGGEDQDFMLNAITKGATVGFNNIPVLHHLSTSPGRFEHCEKNEDRYRKRWLDRIDKLRRIFHVMKGCEYQMYHLARKCLKRKSK